jgi:hypothetical protein
MEQQVAYRNDVRKDLHAEKCLGELTIVVVINPVASGFLETTKRTVDHI